MSNPFLQLNYEPALENLGDEYFDQVTAAKFPDHILRWRNDNVLQTLGLEPSQVADQDFIEAFGTFNGIRPFLALRYHGYQFGEYNPNLGDGRGFLYGQVRGIDGELYDFGTKGSGRTPYSRSADGKLTLKGGVREVLAAEALERLGVKTSRCLSLIETGEQLYRGDEPSPTRSSVMVRFSRSHIRFGTFERLHYLNRGDLIRKLLDHVIATYYPHLTPLSQPERDASFYAELVERVAKLAAQWMVAGFCHAVLNTDNMSITGESFDYGPYAFIPTYNPQFTAAYFDYYRRYAYANQPAVCYWNLEMLQYPLKMAIAQSDLDVGLSKFKDSYRQAYTDQICLRLGIEAPVPPESPEEVEKLITLTLQLLSETQIGYHDFFINLKTSFNPNWRDRSQNIILGIEENLTEEQTHLLDQWRSLYHQILAKMPISQMSDISPKLHLYNPSKILLRPEIETVWEKITVDDNWEPFYELIKEIRI
jgi:serine/tyrosine/threonine adenylyltransferase